MNQVLADLLDLLDLEKIEEDMYLGVSPKTGWQRVYGGQVLGQALVAASRTVPDEDRIAHSLHGYFLRPGDTTIPILYQVDRIRDGKSFTTRRVVAIQRGQAIFNMSASFQVVEPGLDHQVTMPEVPPPEDSVSMRERREAFIRERGGTQDHTWLDRPEPIEMRFTDDFNEFSPEPRDPLQRTWIRTVDTMPDGVRLHQCLLAYASDMTLLDTSYRPHAIAWTDDNFQVASLDHAMWFHRPFRTDEWLLYDQDSPFSGGARGFSRGAFFDRKGRLIASTAQEGLIRLHQKSET
ncbi:MAG: acyl-CoA thioesterase II [Pseudomonadota bacterium]